MKKLKNSLIIICFILIIISVLSFLSTFVSKDKPENVDTSIDWSEVTISCLGDSITMGATIDVPYTETLKETLGLKKCNNYGIGWSTCAVVNDCSCHPDVLNSHNAMCLRYNEISKSSDIIIVMCGMNDKNFVELGHINDTTNTTYYGALNRLCSGLKQNYKDSYIVFMTTFDYSSSVIESYVSTAIKEVCNKYGFVVFDTYSFIEFDRSIDTTDGIHPNQEFVTNVWTPAIAQFIKDNYKQN